MKKNNKIPTIKELNPFTFNRAIKVCKYVLVGKDHELVKEQHKIERNFYYGLSDKSLNLRNTEEFMITFNAISYLPTVKLLISILNVSRNKEYVNIRSETYKERLDIGTSVFYKARKELELLGFITKRAGNQYSYWLNPHLIWGNNNLANTEVNKEVVSTITKVSSFYENKK